jgi:hypothetical protein
MAGEKKNTGAIQKVTRNVQDEERNGRPAICSE